MLSCPPRIYTKEKDWGKEAVWSWTVPKNLKYHCLFCYKPTAKGTFSQVVFMPTFLNNFHIWEQQKNKKKMMFTCTWRRKWGQHVPAARTQVCGLRSTIPALLYTNLTGYWMNTEACWAAQAVVQPPLDIVLCELPTHRGLTPGTPSPPRDGLCSPTRPPFLGPRNLP